MAVNLEVPSSVQPVAGIRLSSVEAGIRYHGRADLTLMEIADGSHTACVFTRNAFCAAPVVVARNHLDLTSPSYLLINAGNANAGTGPAGERAALQCCEAVAGEGNCSAEQVLPFSTGVIGEPLPVAKIRARVRDLLTTLSPQGWLPAARAIMTTDTVPKAVSRSVEIGGQSVSVTGIAKGAGMIRPDMATMLAFVATEARVAPPVLQELLRTAVDASFNRITVDGDTSTNDACVLVATGRSPVQVESEESAAHPVLAQALREVMTCLAQAIVRDAEGATRFITLRVTGASTPDEARAVADCVAHSPLVKTAFFAGDPNWGRILAAVGRAPVEALDVRRVSIHLDDVCVVRDGFRDPSYEESAGARVMGQDEVELRLDLDRGRADTVVWTSDLSHEYVRINAEYRT